MAFGHALGHFEWLLGHFLWRFGQHVGSLGGTWGCFRSFWSLWTLVSRIFHLSRLVKAWIIYATCVSVCVTYAVARFVLGVTNDSSCEIWCGVVGGGGGGAAYSLIVSTFSRP